MNKMPTKRRKAALDARARSYSGQMPNDRTRWSAAYHGYQEGYRAAMRDARRAAAKDIDLSRPTPASNMEGAAWDLFPTIRAFLKPLR